MIKIADLLDRDFSTPIEEIIKVNNADEDTVHTELTEYVATPHIKDEYQRLFQAMAAAPSSPNEGVGVWISGFFGSGKSSFAKNLGYVLANRTVLHEAASDLFLKQVDSQRVSEYVKYLNQGVPYEVFMFDVQVDLSVQTNAEQIAEVMYRVLLRNLDYAEDYDIAELEIELEKEKKLDQFHGLCRQEYNEDWRKVRKGSQKFARASALLHQLDSKPQQPFPSVPQWRKRPRTCHESRGRQIRSQSESRNRPRDPNLSQTRACLWEQGNWRRSYRVLRRVGLWMVVRHRPPRPGRSVPCRSN